MRVNSADLRDFPGRSGVPTEIAYKLALFALRHKEAHVLPVASTGGAARLLFDQGHGPADPATREALANDTVYGALFTSLLGYA